VTSWFRRHEQPPAATTPQEDPDSPDALRRRLWELVQFVNRSAGRLPVEAVVIARQVTDTIREVIETSDERALDVYAVVQINGIVGDYLPTTLRTYLNLDSSVTEQVGPAGRTPRAALREQLESLRDAAAEMLQATRAHDVDLLFSQGNFLRTKFTRSDLDL
jgi:excinuclease UvrABC helicase subunit UvrB